MLTDPIVTYASLSACPLGRKAQGFLLSLPPTINGAGGVICHTAHSWSPITTLYTALALLCCGLEVRLGAGHYEVGAWLV